MFSVLEGNLDVRYGRVSLCFNVCFGVRVRSDCVYGCEFLYVGFSGFLGVCFLEFVVLVFGGRRFRFEGGEVCLFRFI